MPDFRYFMQQAPQRDTTSSRVWSMLPQTATALNQNQPVENVLPPVDLARPVQMAQPAQSSWLGGVLERYGRGAVAPPPLPDSTPDQRNRAVEAENAAASMAMKPRQPAYRSAWSQIFRGVQNA